MANVLTVNELRKKTPAQRATLLRELQTQLRDLSISQRSGTLRKVHQVKVVRRSIAKVLTVEREAAKTASNVTK
jgi:ribosomal protein L29